MRHPPISLHIVPVYSLGTFSQILNAPSSPYPRLALIYPYVHRYAEPAENRAAAARRESALKKLRREDKVLLVDGGVNVGGVFKQRWRWCAGDGEVGSIRSPTITIPMYLYLRYPPYALNPIPWCQCIGCGGAGGA